MSAEVHSINPEGLLTALKGVAVALGGSKQEVREAIHGLGLGMESLPQCEQGLRHIYPRRVVWS